MNRSEVVDIFTELMEKQGIAISKVVRFKPTMTTKEVCEYLERSRPWVIERKELFGGERRDGKRGDYLYQTDKVVAYKINS